uniref:Uncharacterized protein n=1 Tax=Glossina palpalis gambiensis TaxID=67801 RepID=A0A1B0ASH4_9MUSC
MRKAVQFFVGCKSSDYWCFHTLPCSTTIMICARVLDIADFGIVLPKIIKFPKCVHNNNELLTFPSALSPYTILGLVFCCNLQVCGKCILQLFLQSTSIFCPH